MEFKTQTLKTDECILTNNIEDNRIIIKQNDKDYEIIKSYCILAVEGNIATIKEPGKIYQIRINENSKLEEIINILLNPPKPKKEKPKKKTQKKTTKKEETKE